MEKDKRNKEIDEWLKKWSISDFEYADDQSKAFTSAHVVYEFDLMYGDDKAFHTTFTFNPNNWTKASEIFECLCQDMSSYAQYEDMDPEDGMFEFMEEFGYLDNAKSAKEGKYAWKGCKHVYDNLVGYFDELDIKGDDDECLSRMEKIAAVIDRMNEDDFKKEIIKFEEE